MSSGAIATGPSTGRFRDKKASIENSFQQVLCNVKTGQYLRLLPKSGEGRKGKPLRLIDPLQFVRENLAIYVHSDAA
jgi:hypothetical protein